jgi:hypothetical protein
MRHTTDSPSLAQTNSPRRADGRGNQSLATAIVHHIATKHDAEPSTLDPLYEVVDPDALEALFAARNDGSPRSTGQVVFDYSGYEVTVTSKGDIHATPLDD